MYYFQEHVRIKVIADNTDIAMIIRFLRMPVRCYAGYTCIRANMNERNYILIHVRVRAQNRIPLFDNMGETGT